MTMQEMLIGRRYRLTEKIGAGGMADVYRAVDETLGRNVAVKIMHERYANDPTFTARFRQEAQAAANLSSPYIVNIYDWGQEDNTYYIVMELVRGTDLKTLIREKGPLPSKEVAEIGAQVCSALATAHGYDVIHRDIKPQNIMITTDHNVKVMDFGIARAGNTTLTQTGSVLGSAHYVSPEQAQGRQLTPASDLYSLGVVLYEASTGKMPFDGDTPIATALKQVNEQAVRPSRINPQIDPNLELVIGYAMAKDPRARYATANAMRTDLVKVIRGEAIIGPGSALSAGVAGVGAGAAAAAGVGSSDPTQLLGKVPAAAGVGSSGGVGSDQQTTVMPQLDGAYGAGGGAAGRQLNGMDGALNEKKKNKTWIWILVAVLALAAILGAGYLLGLFGGGSNKIAVPDVRGETVVNAAEKLTEQDLLLGKQEEAYSATVGKGKIISQDPKANTKVEAKTKVDVVVSMGPEMKTVPDVTKKSQDDARKILEAANFKVTIGETAYSPEVESGCVISQDPAGNSEAPKGSTVTLVISQGVDSGTVPDVVGQSKSKAQDLLKTAGFNTTIVTASDYSDVTKDQVTSQDYKAGTQLAKGSTVTITVSKGPDPNPTITVPNVVGLNWGKAISQLVGAGFACDQNSDINWAGTDGTGEVKRQSPTAGSSAAKGTHIKLTVDDDNPNAPSQ